MPEMQPEKHGLMSPQTAAVYACYKVILDALAEILQKEGAQKFEHDFLQQIHQHSAG